jgi:hypothetical protein
VGLLGVLSLYPTLGPIAETIAKRGNAPPIPAGLLRGLLLINPTILLLVAVAIGTALAPRLHLGSHLAERFGSFPQPRLSFRRELPLAIAAGIATALAVLALDAVSRPLLGPGAAALQALESEQPRTLWVTLSGMLYGGITEELMMRWGLLSLLAWLAWRLAQGGKGHPRSWIFYFAILAAALLFGAGHLGAVDAQIGLTPALVARTLALNSLAGVVFGWLFWRRSLEAAMIAHATGHVIFTLVTVLF